MITHTSPRELHAWLQGAGQRPAPLLLDVREPWEHGICRIAGSRLVPMQQIPSQLDTLPRESAIVVICHHGMRSLQVAAFLVEAAFHLRAQPERRHRRVGGAGRAGNGALLTCCAQPDSASPPPLSSLAASASPLRRGLISSQSTPKHCSAMQPTRRRAINAKPRRKNCRKDCPACCRWLPPR